ncbi:MAG: hypothetical protein WD960_03600 [Gemmatimonadota bacterium]
MFGIGEAGTAPVDAWIVDGSDGDPAVEWSDDHRAAPEGAVLPDFVALTEHVDERARLVAQASFAPAVVGFVERHGPLRLCTDHRLPWAGHGLATGGLCKPALRPEPLMEWAGRAMNVRRILRIVEAARTAEREGIDLPDAFEAHDRARGWDPNIGWRAIERDKRPGGPDDLWAVAAVARDRLEGDTSDPATPADAWTAIDRTVGHALAAFPSRIETRATGSGIRLHLQPAGVLGRVFVELAIEVGGMEGFASCDGCGRLHSRERAPKRGQGCYCSARCRKRAHARRRRAG